MAKKLTKDELDKYRALNMRHQKIHTAIAEASLKLYGLQSAYPAVEGELRNFNNDLVEKYGEGRIDPKTGEVMPIMEKVEENGN